VAIPRPRAPLAEEIVMNVRTLLAVLSLTLAPAFAMAQDKVVYHINDAATQALGGLRNAKNQLDTEPTTQITFVTHANGVDFLMHDAKDRNGNEYEIAVQELVRRGVRFEVCEITLKNRQLKKNQFITEAGFTPSGVVRITKLQGQGHAYLRP
jgi:intracellular sulfur oxidation DsrE/DsrF family protein